MSSEMIPFGIQEAAESIAKHKAEAERAKQAEELREGYEQAVNEFSNQFFWRMTPLDKSDIERAMAASWREDETVLDGGELSRIIVPFTKEERGYNFWDRTNDHEYKLIQNV